MHPFTGKLILVACVCGGCVSRNADQPEVIVYTAHDATFSEPILARFTEVTGIAVRPKFDVESTKTVGLVNAILAEASRPRCDVFWNNEILNTLRLAERGLLETYPSPVGANYPPAFKGAEGNWYGFAARARIIACNTEVVPQRERPRSIYDLADPQWKAKTGIAKPLFGTTATHAACLFHRLGEEKAKAYFRSLKTNEVQVLSGNKQVAESVASGAIAFGLTDTDDALQMIDKGFPVEIIYPDQQPDGLGTLFIPNTLCIIKNGPHPTAAKRLVDYLLSPEVEKALAQGPAGQIPLNPEVDVATRVETPTTVKAMEIDYAAAAAQWEAAARFIEAEFAR